ncbi:histone H1 [Aliifodinibius sp. S!AR15-10]|uniref:histone H1 n=1 Tax=Aliifodinibius sp. S!AR15-10 TaxID=2950437 RepID=UPI0028667D29|nr:histone H1 [Aliifodinibius sp. S!AR15-10]MDR8389601.1 histone H1 [Aliifodinibius sp. S!AR15-10]
MSRFDDIKNLINGIEGDMTKFYSKGNKAAGTRARKGLQEVKKIAQDIRLEIQDIKNRS